MRIAVIGRVDFAAAMKVTGEPKLLPAAGAHRVTPLTIAAHPEGMGVGVGVGVGVGLGFGVGLGVGVGVGVGVGLGFGVGVGVGVGVGPVLGDPVKTSAISAAVAAAAG